MNTLAPILSSKIRAEFFRLFFGVDQQEMYMREIERRTGFAIGTIRQEASNLLQLNLIKERRSGNRIYFSANSNHPLFKEIRNMVLKTIGLADVIRDALKNSDISYAFIYGSVASGNQKPTSDIDLFTIGDIGFRALSKLLRNPGEILNQEINFNIMTREEFIGRIRNNDHFIMNVMKSPKLMIIGSEDELTKLGQ